MGKPSHPGPAERGLPPPPPGEPPDPAALVRGEAARGATPRGREGVGAGVSGGPGRAAGPLGLRERWVIKGADGELEFDPEKQGLVGTCSRGGGGGAPGLSLDPWLRVCSANFADETLCAEAQDNPGSSAPGAPPPASALCPPAPSPLPPLGCPPSPGTSRSPGWRPRHLDDGEGGAGDAGLPSPSAPTCLPPSRTHRGREAPGSLSVCLSVCLPEFHVPQA